MRELVEHEKDISGQCEKNVKKNLWQSWIFQKF